jgi:hypothetical protein
MSNECVVLCSRCSTVAVAALEGDHLCAGCLMRLLMSADEPLSVKRLSVPTRTGQAQGKPVPPQFLTATQ